MTIVETLIGKAGGVNALAQAVGISHVSVIKWRQRGVIPADRAEAVAKACGVRPADVRPDLAALFGGPSSPECMTPEAAKDAA